MSPAFARSLCTVLLCWAAAPANAVELAAPALELTVSDSTLAVNSADRALAPSTQTMVWARVKHMQLGVGVEQPLRVGPAALHGLDAAPFGGSLFKAQLSDQTVITLRPRRGRAVVSLQHRW